jgi:hypothetical protein
MLGCGWSSPSSIDEPETWATGEGRDRHDPRREPEQKGRRPLGALSEDEDRHGTQPSRKRGGRGGQ